METKANPSAENKSTLAFSACERGQQGEGHGRTTEMREKSHEDDGGGARATGGGSELQSENGNTERREHWRFLIPIMAYRAIHNTTRMLFPVLYFDIAQYFEIGVGVAGWIGSVQAAGESLFGTLMSCIGLAMSVGLIIMVCSVLNTLRLVQTTPQSVMTSFGRGGPQG